MKLDDLLTRNSEPRYWFNDSTDATYISASDCPTKEEALAAYERMVGDAWEPDYLDDVVVEILPCCDHDVEDCDLNSVTRLCNKAVERKVWAFEP